MLKNRLSPYKRRQNIIGVLFFVPSLIILLTFLVAPFIAALGFSLTDYRLLSAPKFVGLKNYVNIFSDSEFWHSFRITFLYVILRVFVLVTLSLFIAFVLNEKFRFRGALQLAYILPFLFPLAATSVIWKIIFRPFGLMESFLSLFGVPPIAWLANGDYALFAILITTVWSGIGYFSVIMLAGVQTLSRDAIEASIVDGTNGWQRFRLVIMPMLKPTLFYIVFVATVASLQGYAPFLVMTGGGPGSSTRVLGLIVYQSGFVHMRMGYASTMTVVLLVVIIAITLIQRRYLKSFQEE